ncbi:MAG: zf-HC2 domain-containing protein [Hyalangium sp.]|uniref:zf-HC2 domain-containing protein n=1 Tax=Hyalangium sp. TaxID=2028555 RepID=UPI00389A90CA
MKPQNLHAQEDRLLDLVYGELPPTEAQAVESHLEGCTRCSELLADIRGVRTTMAQLPLEPAPDAGLESLLAYAQQAARNAAAGPAPKPTWWRRWLVPVVSVAAVCAFGIISIQVSKTVDLSPQLAVKGESVHGAPASKEAQAPAPMPSSPAANAAPAQTEESAAAAGAAMAQGLSERDSLNMTPPRPYPAAKLDEPLMAKEAPRKKAFMSGPKAPSANWSNAGAGGGYERGKVANEDLAALEKKSADKVEKDEEYSQRDAMTQMRGIAKSKTMVMGSTRGDSSAQQPMPQATAMPAPAAAPPVEEEPAPGSDGKLAEGAVQRQMPSQGSSLRLNGGRTGAAQAAEKPAADAPADDFDDLFSSKTVVAKREQRQESRAATPPPPPSVAAPRPSTPSSMGSAAPSMSTASAQPKGGQSAWRSPAELSKLAAEAFRSGNRVREAQLLAQALDEGAAGSERLGLLNRLCDAQFAIGQREAAFQTCKQVLQEGPRTGAAQMAQRRMSRETNEAEDAKAYGGARASKKAAPAELDTAAPASAPAQAQ